MDYMFQAGFLGTRAPIFMDVVTLIVALLSKELFLRLSSRICDNAKPLQISNNINSFLII